MNKEFKTVVNVYFDHSNGILAITVFILLWYCGYDVFGAVCDVMSLLHCTFICATSLFTTYLSK
jgi:hypothetical protein